VQIAIEGTALLAPTDRIALQRICDQALDLFRRGQDAAAQWAILADALNVGESLTRLRICSDDASVAKIDAAQQALAAVHQRHAERKTWAMRASELQALDDGIEIHRIQIDHCTVREYVEAVEATRRRLQAALAGNAPVGAVVCVGGMQ